jgi:hypothetical protein
VTPEDRGALIVSALCILLGLACLALAVWIARPYL